ncbi:MAG: hypothetical protein ABS36_17445 [Acidobacteria bacterium SCN 69-37]|nr:MAG: hypothetical protein ABS36_17445 [Acidobacteria bacterium SCN 69-37]
MTFTDLRQARASGEWLTFSGTYDGQRHSALTTIDRTTAERLRLAWMVQLPGGDEPLAVTPLVVGGTMFVNLPLGDVYAIDVLSGDVLWRTMRTDAPALTATAVEGRINQGMAVLGDTLFVTTLDAHLIALDIRTGARRWTVSVAEAQGGSGYAIVGAPLAVDGRIVVGVAGGDRGIRGFLAAYAPDDGRRLWRFETIPADGEDGHDTWGTTDGWRRGGGLTPITGSYDPETGLIYWGVGNPSPAFNGDARPGDNLYTSSLVAIDAASGQLRWHYQFVPHDEWEYGVTHVPVLSTDVSPGGQSSRLVQLASRNGFFYTLNRDTGAFLRATPFARQTWNDGFDAVGRPRIRPRARPVSGGTFTTPGHAGATSWWPPSYDASTGTFFVLTRDGYANTFYKDRRLTWPDGAFWGGRAAGVPGVAIVTEVRAIDAATGDLRWRYRFPGTVVGSAGGLLSTAGGIVFAGEKARFVALDARSGHELWNFHTGGIVVAAPVTYAREARQFVTIVAGRAVLTFSLTP